MDKMELRSKAKTMNPDMNLGKAGLTPSVITEIKTKLRQKKLIKIKMLPSLSEGSDKKEIAKKLAAETDSILIDHIGFTYVLAEKSTVEKD